MNQRNRLWCYGKIPVTAWSTFLQATWALLQLSQCLGWLMPTIATTISSWLHWFKLVIIKCWMCCITTNWLIAIKSIKRSSDTSWVQVIIQFYMIPCSALVKCDKRCVRSAEKIWVPAHVEWHWGRLHAISDNEHHAETRHAQNIIDGHIKRKWIAR